MQSLHQVAYATVIAPLMVVSAQSSARSVDFGGVVFQAGDTSVKIVNAEISLGDGRPSRYTNGDGRFRFLDLRAGAYDVRFRALGYQPQTIHIVLDSSGTQDRTIALARLANALTEVRIEGKLMKVPARYEDVYRRAARGWGKFITEDDIARRQPWDVKALLTDIPGVLVNDRGITFQRCQAGLQSLAITPDKSTRNGAFEPPQRPVNIQVYVDGVRLTRMNQNGVVEGSADRVIRDILPTSIYAMEVYTGVSQIPAEFLDDACAVIAIWTKSR